MKRWALAALILAGCGKPPAPVAAPTPPVAPKVVAAPYKPAYTPPFHDDVGTAPRTLTSTPDSGPAVESPLQAMVGRWGRKEKIDDVLTIGPDGTARLEQHSEAHGAGLTMVLTGTVRGNTSDELVGQLRPDAESARLLREKAAEPGAAEGASQTDQRDSDKASLESAASAVFAISIKLDPGNGDLILSDGQSSPTRYTRL